MLKIHSRCNTSDYISVCSVHCSHSSGRNSKAADAKWKEMYADPKVRRDQVDAVNSDGESIGKARSNAKKRFMFFFDSL